ncbi:UDP-glucose dehydrogenase family protein [Pseudobdellovibrio exovorus]|uniref:UDP-glucose 6-dehydrogenase n=1 Tax=Pseudobdellovibrio exovorus JSS TaxID=1184267 RepID=M4V8Z5_9BACT|nr:UDP-glucose/GDP-mannose dehydrogenase family protein [Pseudobdellovibrio exovorus]AGH95693.1 hypothetical protein A11Q_1477 [Pseudobdellovibrio exovorus JSS]
MNLCIIGCGRIGLTTALCFAKQGVSVKCHDTDSNIIDRLKSGQNTFFEPEITPLLQDLTHTQKITFELDLIKCLTQYNILMVCVGTPNTLNRSADLSSFEKLIASINNHSSSPKTIIIRSTVPPGTQSRLTQKYPKHRFISSPEFLREGSAIHDCLNPDRIIVGSNDHEDLNLFKELYTGFKLQSEQFLFMDPTSAEMSKYASNIFLAARVSLMNEFSRICAKNSADIKQVQRSLAADHRIGDKFLNAGLGYGGSCFPKDLEAFVHYARELHEDTVITSAVHHTNQLQIQNFAEKIVQSLSSYNKAQPIAIWGLSFKPNTDDLREAPALKVADILLQKGHKLKLYDPKANGNLVKHYQHDSQVIVCATAEEAVKDCSGLVICTEWSEFLNADLQHIKSLMKYPIIFDGRNIYSPEKMKSLGFKYYAVGRHS